MYSYFNKNKKWVLPVSLVVLIFFLTSFGDEKRTGSRIRPSQKRYM